MPFCTKCGADMAGRKNFCGKCGVKLGAVAGPSPRLKRFAKGFLIGSCVLLGLILLIVALSPDDKSKSVDSSTQATAREPIAPTPVSIESPLSPDEQILGRGVLCLIGMDASQRGLLQGIDDIKSAKEELVDRWRYPPPRANQIISSASTDYNSGLWNVGNCPQYLLEVKLPDGSSIGAD
jgi:hypothetical protein